MFGGVPRFYAARRTTQASEGSFFKKEQEDDLRKYRDRRLKEGKLARSPALDGSGTFEGLPTGGADKLPSISAQETRLSAPDEVLRRRVSSQMPPTAGKGVPGHRSATWMSLGYAVPRTGLGRWRWRAMQESMPEPLALLPEEAAALVKRNEVAQRALVAGTRALLYGSALTLVAVLAGGRLAAYSLGVHNLEDVRCLTQRTFLPLGDRLRESLLPLKGSIERFVGSDNTNGTGSRGGRFGEQLVRG